MEGRTEYSEDTRKEQAELFYNTTKYKLSIGETEAAVRCLLEAETLHSTPHAKELLCKILDDATGSKQTASGSADVDQNGDGDAPGNVRNDSRKSQSIDEPVVPAYTRQEVEAVRRISKCRDYYEVLIVSREASSTDIKEAYKKLAKTLHPDKNRAPGATEAFQELGQAEKVLSDPQMRAEYDRYLEEMIRRASTGVGTDPNEKFEIEIPTSVLVGGFVFAAAGLFGMWWYSKEKRKREEEKMRDTHGGMEA